MFYKYKKFDHQTLELLITDRLFFADPLTFNDPLDTRPYVEGDLPNTDLKEVLRRLIEQRTLAEMTAAAQSLKYRGPKTASHIEEQSRKRALRDISDIEYNASNPDYELDDPFQFLLVSEISTELLKQYNKGIVSFAGQADCPLMWSHYADQHNGLCIGYSIPANPPVELGTVTYGGTRMVRASDIAKMLDGDATAQKRVDAIVLFTKAKPWKYEHERRLIGERGLQDSPLELEEVIFGLRCPDTVKFAVVKALERRNPPATFYEMRESRNSFELTKCPLDLEEALAFWPRRSVSLLESIDAMARDFTANTSSEDGNGQSDERSSFEDNHRTPQASS